MPNSARQRSSSASSTARNTTPPPSQADESERPAAQATLRRSLALPPGPRTSSAASVFKPITVSLGSSQRDQQQQQPSVVLRADPNLTTTFKREDDAELFELWAAGK